MLPFYTYLEQTLSRVTSAHPVVVSVELLNNGRILRQIGERRRIPVMRFC